MGDVRVVVTSEYELDRLIEGHRIRLRALGTSIEELSVDGPSCHHEREVWDELCAHWYLRYGEVLNRA